MWIWIKYYVIPMSYNYFFPVTTKAVSLSKKLSMPSEPHIGACRGEVAWGLWFPLKYFIIISTIWKRNSDANTEKS